MQVFKPHEEKDQEERAKVRLNPLSPQPRTIHVHRSRSC